MELFDSSDEEEQPPYHLQRWRQIQRHRLIDERLSLSPEIRGFYARQIIEKLNQFLPIVKDLTVSGYWPCKGEPDLRPWLKSLHRGAGRAALPVVVAKNKPLDFRAWRDGDPLERGVWNILHPAQGSDVLPDVIIAPLVGFDTSGYRLGYGGGYFDRTLAALENRPVIVGVGYGESKLRTIHPQAYDIPMDVVITQTEILTFDR
ncbi:5-formyltetrahydrofolate cyclo-ligase [Methyloligella halotolerans]|uniref:5-formyltetrahydrofolate cyclo-ligase n=1 Tax=Methyloligella halotolerans TaxID=1177755 RepID=UPI00083DC363|nr:5-formyltetrahydrofolate cyclo-ligase [Methyloligella halotolerans]